jgi:hypothetical protein
VQLQPADTLLLHLLLLLTAWDGTLDDDEIQAVSAYVYDQATGSKW